MSRRGVGQWAAWPPVRNPRFWVVQALIAGVFVLHQLDAGQLGADPLRPVPHLAVEGLFLLPLLYAALNFGLPGSLATAAWVTLLMTLDITVDVPGMSSMNLWAHYVELGTLDIVALVVGRGVETQRLARARAEKAESRYRQLYEIACVPILVLDGGGVVRDANPAAWAIFGANVIGQADQALLPGGLLSKERAGQVLGLPDGRDYRLSLAPFTGAHGSVSTQVIFEDVTEERRERRRASRYAAMVVEAGEDQRWRLARELHDEPLQLFIHLARRLESFAEAPGVPAAVVSDLAEARQHALDAAAWLRSLTRELRPSVLNDLGLAPAISSLLSNAEEQVGLQIELQVTGEAVRLAPEVELGAFRIAEEAVRNALRHAQANRLQVRLAFGIDDLGLAIADDGCGFAPDGPGDLTETRLGLISMRERADLLGGHLRVRSAPGAGTVVEARLPLGSATARVGTGVATSADG